MDFGRADLILLALDQALRSVHDYTATGEPEDRAAFQRRLTRLEELLALLETRGPAERRAAAGVRRDLPEIRAAGFEALARPDALVDPGVQAQLARLATLRTQAAATLEPYRRVELAQASQGAAGWSPRAIIGGGSAALGMALAGALALARISVA